MRFAVRYDLESFEIEGKGRDAAGHATLAHLDAQVVTYDDIIEHANTLAEFAQAGTGNLPPEQMMAHARRFDRCARSFDRVQTQLRRSDLKLFAVVNAWALPETLDNLLGLYRTAVMAAGRQDGALILEPCVEHIFAPTDRDMQQALAIWKDPRFAAGFVTSGPVAYAAPRQNNPPSLEVSRSPLDYGGTPRDRLQLRDATAGPPPPGETYFGPRSKHPPAPPDVVAFLDYVVWDEVVYISYLSVRTDARGRGYARQLIDELYERHPDARQVDFGAIHSDAIAKLYRERRELAAKGEGPRTYGKIRNPGPAARTVGTLKRSLL